MVALPRLYCCIAPDLTSETSIKLHANTLLVAAPGGYSRPLELQADTACWGDLHDICPSLVEVSGAPAVALQQLDGACSLALGSSAGPTAAASAHASGGSLHRAECVRLLGQRLRCLGGHFRILLG